MNDVDRFHTGRWDAGRDGVVVDGDPEVVVTRGALEGWTGRAVEPREASALVAADADRFLRAARATPADDGTVTLTARILAGRSWEVEPYAD